MTMQETKKRRGKGKNSLTQLFPFFKNYKLPALLCPVLMLIEVVADVMMPLLMSRIVDQGMPAGDVAYIMKTGLLMVALAMIALFCGAYSSRLASIAAVGAGTELRQTLFDRIQGFSFSNLDRFSVPSLITRLTSDINNFQQAAIMSMRMMIRAPFMLILALCFALSINRELGVVFLVAIPVLAVSVALIMTNAHPRFRKLQKKLDDLNNSIQENLINIRVVKSFVRTEYEKKKFGDATDSLKDTTVRAVKLVILNMPIMQLVVYGCILAILWLGSGMVMDGRLLTGQLISFISYVTQILISLMMLSMIFLTFTRAKASADRMAEVLEVEPDLKDPPRPLREVADGSIEFENVSFRYASGSGEDTLRGVNLKIRSGEIIGIIGSTGAAKSTLVSLIPRLYDVAEGTVRVGGQDVRAYSMETLRDAVAMVLQKNTLFAGSVRDNLRWGNAEATDEDLRAACESAQAWNFVSTLSGGFDFMIEQGGANLSGGQRQRLCIARALLKKPRIIILDDSTSAVDMATDAKIRDAFERELSGITTLVVAQRVRSIAHADRVIVMDDGRIDAIGTPDELLANNVIYREVYMSQQEGVLAE